MTRPWMNPLPNSMPGDMPLTAGQCDSLRQAVPDDMDLMIGRDRIEVTHDDDVVARIQLGERGVWIDDHPERAPELTPSLGSALDLVRSYIARYTAIERYRAAGSNDR